MANGHKLPSGIWGHEILPNKAPKVVNFFSLVTISKKTSCQIGNKILHHNFKTI